MRIKMKCVLVLTVLYCCCFCCWGEQLRNLPCPNAEDIFPCVCTLGSDTEMEMDCSNVTSNAELAYIFSTDFQFPDFESLVIENNYYLTTLNVFDLGHATFKKIEMSYTALERIEYDALMASYDTLQDLTVEHSKLNFFPFEEMERFTKLAILSLPFNELVGFPTLASTTLQCLDLNSNPIGHIDRTSLANLPSLSQIYLDNAGIKQILPGTFTEVPGLSLITLTSNEIEVLEAGTVEVDEIFTVNFDNNSLTYIAEGAFTGVHGLYVSNNQLTELSEAVFRPILDYGDGWLNAEGNPLKCGCDIAWLITNDTYMSLMWGTESCHSGELLTDLDPDMYFQLCS